MKLVIVCCIMLAGLLLVLAFAPVARAAECRLTEDAFAESVKAQHWTIVGAANYDGAVTDSVLIVETDSAIVLVGFKDGCWVAGPVALENVRDKGVPA